MSHLAFRTEGTEARKVQLTSSISHVLITTIGSVLTEASCVPGTFTSLTVRIHMKVETFGVATFAVFAEKPALGHLLQIILVEKLTSITLLTKSPQPVLADDRLFAPMTSTTVGVSLRAGSSAWTTATQKEAAYLTGHAAIYIYS